MVERSAHDLFVWFEDSSGRRPIGSVLRTSAGKLECLLPQKPGLRLLDRRYVPGHFHLLERARFRCDSGLHIAEIYHAALMSGTVAWIGTGEQYLRAWSEGLAAGDFSWRGSHA